MTSESHARETLLSFLPAAGEHPLAREYFRRAIERGRLAHAYLFLGPPAARKERFALELAKALFCSEGSPCGDCGTCRAVEHGNHPGVAVHRPAEGKRVDIDTVREVCERSHLRRDHAYIAIIEEADSMNEPAANAILKTLEEPPGEFVLILLASSIGSLLPTIVSRCHRVLFTSLEETEGAPIDESVLEEPNAPGFFARNDPKDWLARAVPGATSARERVGRLLGALVERTRADLAASLEKAGDATGSRDPGIDHLLRQLEQLFDLRRALDGYVNAELVLERVLAALRGPRPA